jgi:hypothetical protein
VRNWQTSEEEENSRSAVTIRIANNNLPSNAKTEQRSSGQTMPPKQRSQTSSLASNVNLSELLSRLSLAASSNDFDRLLQVSNDVLKSSSTNALAAKQKILALIKLDKYKDALTFLEESTFLDRKEIVLEHGFCLYKLGRGIEAEKVLEQGSGRAVEHIQAQNVFLMKTFGNIRLIEWKTLPDR